MSENSIFIFTAFGLFLGVIITVLVSRALKTRLYKNRASLAKHAEENAADLLEIKGYRVLGRQKRAPLEFSIDGQKMETVVIADYLVKRKNKIFVAEVKNRDLEGKMLDPGIRRQLLEYFAAFAVDGVLLVDMIKRKIHSVEFKKEAKRSNNILWFIIAVLLSIITVGLMVLLKIYPPKL